MIPVGYCQCGCGQKTWIATSTNKPRGWFKGKPVLYCHGHANRVHIEGLPVPLCACGCGEPVRIATKSDRVLGFLRGRPRRFVKGHNRKRKPKKVGPGSWETPLSAAWKSYLTAFDRLLYARDTEDVVARCIDLARFAEWMDVPLKLTEREANKGPRRLPELYEVLPNWEAYRTIRERLCDPPSSSLNGGSGTGPKSAGTS